MIGVSDGSAFIAIILFKKCAHSKTTCGSWNFVQQGKLSNFTFFFQWNEFGPSAGLTAGIGSVRAKLLYNFNLFYWGPFLPKIHENEQIGVYFADELTNYMQTMMWKYPE